MLDTNVAIAILNGDPAAVSRWQCAEEVLMPPPVLAELLYGALRSVRAAQNTARVWEFAASMGVCSWDPEVCALFAQAKADLARGGRPIPTNDLWIAAHCLRSGAILASRDVHFDSVPGLVREAW